MIRDVLAAVVRAVNSVQPPGVSAVIPASTNTGTGAVSFDASSQAFGTFNGVISVVAPGLPGAATAQLSLDGGNNFDATFTIPIGTPGLSAPLPNMSASLLSPGLSGLVLNFSGNFHAGDSFSFQVLPSITFLTGAEEESGEDTLFPRVVFVPTEDEFSGSEDYAQGRDQRTQARSILTDVAHFETHCWGIDYDRTEILRDTVINGIWFAVQATVLFQSGRWESTRKVAKAGQLYVLNWTVKKPVLVLSQDTLVVQPPFTAAITPQVSH